MLWRLLQLSPSRCQEYREQGVYIRVQYFKGLGSIPNTCNLLFLWTFLSTGFHFKSCHFAFLRFSFATKSEVKLANGFEPATLSTNFEEGTPLINYFFVDKYKLFCLEGLLNKHNQVKILIFERGKKGGPDLCFKPPWLGSRVDILIVLCFKH